jgi:glutaminase
VLDALSAYAGRPLDIDEAVFESERSTGHRNRAIGHMLRNYGILTMTTPSRRWSCTSASARCGSTAATWR